jgi:hypothetical protein
MIRRGLAVALCAGALLMGARAEAIIGMPWTPLSYAGVARRTARRTAFVGAAAVGTAAAVGAMPYGGVPYGGMPYGAVPAVPYGCVVGAPCGGVVYQPMYQGTTIVYVPR